MSCVFCDSFYHVSEKCEMHVTDKARKSIAQSKGYCGYCLTKKCVSVTSEYVYTKCKTAKTCYICLTKNHHTVYCPDKYTAANFFIPNIDQDLLPRFLTMLATYEKYLLAFQSPKTLKLCQLLPMNIGNNERIASFNVYLEPHVNICQKFLLYNFNSSFDRKIFDNINSKKWEICAKNVEISRSSVSPFDVYALLSSRTKKLKFIFLKFSEKIKMDNIFGSAPNLEEFDYVFDKIIPDNATIQLDEKLFNNNYGKKFKKFKITVGHDFNIEKLIPFLEKNIPHFKIDLYVRVPVQEKNGRKLFLAKVSQHFVPSSNIQALSIFIEKRKKLTSSYCFVGTFVVKKICI